MALDRLGAAWDAFGRLSASEKREFVRWLRDWHLQRRAAALAERGGHLGRVQPVQEFATVLAGLDVASLNADR